MMQPGVMVPVVDDATYKWMSKDATFAYFRGKVFTNTQITHIVDTLAAHGRMKYDE